MEGKILYGGYCMNLALRKLAMIEKDFIAREEAAKIDGYTSCPIDRDFKEKISRVLDQVRYI
jgi:hypothetical protein